MTIEELKAVRASWDQKDVLLVIVAAAASGALSFLGAYLSKKGENRALKEDLDQLTRKVESIKSEIASKQHFSHLRYEREMQIYREFWKQLRAFYQHSLLPFAALGDDPHPEEKRKLFSKALGEFGENARDNIPFFPREIWDELRAFESTCSMLVSAQERIQLVKNDHVYGELAKRIEGLEADAKNQIEKIEQSIRARLEKFDFASLAG